MSDTTSVDTDTAYNVYVREPGQKRAKLLASGGRLTGLKVHAITAYGDEGRARLIAAVEQLRADNPDVVFDVKPA